MRTSLALLRTGIFAVCLGAQPREARAVILIAVLDLLTLFSIVGIEFTSYASSEHATLRVEDTRLLLAAGGCLLAGRLGAHQKGATEWHQIIFGTRDCRASQRDASAVSARPLAKLNAIRPIAFPYK